MSTAGFRKRVGVLISGRGSNMAALIEAAKNADYPAEITLVISDKPEAAGLQTAAANGIATGVIERRAHADKAGFEAAIDALLQEHGVEIVCLAGFMRLLSAWFVDRWYGRLLNIHPSLLPSFKGLDVQEQVLAAGVRIAGCTVHLVSAEMDAGPIIMQAAVPVLSSDDEASLSARILKQEHTIYPEALRLIADGSARLQDNRIILAAGVAGHRFGAD
jgi:phosphoribosylglycinamide formyltransferase 1